MNQKVVVRYVQSKFKHVELDVAMNGQEAVEMVEAKGLGYYNLVLMDLFMPVMDGFQATQAIRKIHKEQKMNGARGTQQTKNSKVDGTDAKVEEGGVNDGPPVIVALTANVLPDVEARCLSIGMNAVMSKPISFTKLHSLIAQL